jgi:molecular chaperone DnaJ
VAKRTVKIPGGVDDGSQIRISGEGDSGTRGGPAGNLYVVLRVKPHSEFMRDEDDLVYDLPLNVTQAALGTVIEVPTLDGDPVPLRVEPGTQPGYVFTIRGRGVPHLRGGGRGDLLVRANVLTPTKLTEEQRELLERLADSMGTPSDMSENGGLFGRIRDALGG